MKKWFSVMTCILLLSVCFAGCAPKLDIKTRPEGEEETPPATQPDQGENETDVVIPSQCPSLQEAGTEMTLVQSDINTLQDFLPYSVEGEYGSRDPEMILIWTMMYMLQHDLQKSDPEFSGTRYPSQDVVAFAQKLFGEDIRVDILELDFLEHSGGYLFMPGMGISWHEVSDLVAYELGNDFYRVTAVEREIDMGEIVGDDRQATYIIRKCNASPNGWQLIAYTH